jgi:multiple sugar transport system substrate-binding protein
LEEGLRNHNRTVGAVLAITALLAAGGCGFSSEEKGGAGGGKAINWYVFNEPGGAFEEAIKNCNQQARGRYRINYVRLPTDADQQRELVARRLAAKDPDIDVIGMDVIWTAEFAEAGWIKPWTLARRQAAAQGKLAGPLRTVEYRGQVWGIPFTTNTQLLWYRKDRVKNPPRTWDEMIDRASREGSAIEVQAARYEGFAVWVNSLVASAGGQIVDANGRIRVDGTARRAAQIIRKLATSPAAPAGMSNNREDPARLGFESGRSNYQVNYTFVYASAGEKPGFQQKMGWAPYPGVEPGRPSRVTLGGINLAVGAYTKNPGLAFDAAECLAQPQNQVAAAEKGGLPPTTQSLYDTPPIQKAFPFAALLRDTLQTGVPRPVSPAYSDISLAIQKSYHPPEGVSPGNIISQLKDKLERAVQGEIF